MLYAKQVVRHGKGFIVFACIARPSHCAALFHQLGQSRDLSSNSNSTRSEAGASLSATSGTVAHSRVGEGELLKTKNAPPTGPDSSSNGTNSSSSSSSSSSSNSSDSGSQGGKGRDKKGLKETVVDLVAQFTRGTKVLWVDFKASRQTSARKKAGEALTFQEDRQLRQVMLVCHGDRFWYGNPQHCTSPVHHMLLVRSRWRGLVCWKICLPAWAGSRVIQANWRVPHTHITRPVRPSRSSVQVLLRNDHLLEIRAAIEVAHWRHGRFFGPENDVCSSLLPHLNGLSCSPHPSHWHVVHTIDTFLLCMYDEKKRPERENNACLFPPPPSAQAFDKFISEHRRFAPVRPF